MTRRDAYYDPLRIVTEAARARIAEDCEKAPEDLKKVFRVVAERLTDPSLGATEAWEAAGGADTTLVAIFRAITGVSLKQYIEDRRIEMAYRLILLTDLDLGSISEWVGYENYPTFIAAYQRQHHSLPSAVPRENWPPSLIDDLTSAKVGDGLLTTDEFVCHIEDLIRLCPALAKTIHIGDCPDPEPVRIIDGAASDRLKAEGLWQMIRDLPFAEQCRELRGHLFRSEVLFNLLRKKSRLEGRKSRQRGIEVAKLALVSLERSDHVFGGRVHELRALGWAWLGNAHRLKLDFSAAAGAFEQADREWAAPRAVHDMLVLANICALKGSLRLLQRDYLAARQELDHSLALFRAAGETVDEARELVTRAMVYTYEGKPSCAVKDLREAVSLIDELEEQEIAFAIRGNLANALARAGQTKDAAKELELARQLKPTIDNPLGTYKLDCIAGDLAVRCGDLVKAQGLYRRARSGFRAAGERGYFSVVSVDLMVVHSMQDDWESVEVLVTDTLPILSSLRLHNETLATVHLLAQAIETQGLTRRLLHELRVALRQDPLSSTDPRRGQASWTAPASSASHN